MIKGLAVAAVGEHHGEMGQSEHRALQSAVIGVLKRDVQRMSTADITAKLASVQALPVRAFTSRGRRPR
ncbi:MAG TPA: hypothetical protein VFH61_12500 [Thermoleophilia bacterium]|nr:hypothetical protein [Thermoleophilia bacterium]